LNSLRTEVRDGMRIEWDATIKLSDGAIVRADLFRPDDSGRYPAILSYGPYGKWLAWQDGYPSAWALLEKHHPDAVAGSSNRYQTWETVDPEKWVPDGYVCVRVDSRGSGRSAGYSNHNSPQETRDLYDCIEWAAAQPWSNGKVGLCGISYYAANQWRVATLQPPHLAAICVWEGYADVYRDANYHGGILSTFRKTWQEMQAARVQHGWGERGPVSAMNGELVCGPETLSDAELARNRADIWGELLAHPLDCEYYRARSPQWDKVVVPLLSAGNWGGQGLHLRGNVEGFVRAASRQKWLEMHGDGHWAEFYTDYGVALQKRFFDFFLKGKSNGWDKQPPLQLQVRLPGERFVLRYEKEWPLARTQWTKFYLQPGTRALGREPLGAAAPIEYEAMGEGVTFLTPPLSEATEITGPSALKLFLSSSTTDADVFAVLRVFAPNGEEVVFQGTLDPHTPIGQGWLRASHRKLDPELSLPYRPYHTHDELWPLKPGEPVELDIEILPTCIVVPKSYRIGLTILGRDYEYAGATATLSNIKNAMKGCGPFLHDDPITRPPAVFAGRNTLHFDAGREPYLLLPVVPPKSQ